MTPYIPQQLRSTASRAPADAGELAYALTEMILSYMSHAPARFKDYAEVLGVLEAVKLELYRRKVAPHEDAACAANGDVF